MNTARIPNSSFFSVLVRLAANAAFDALKSQNLRRSIMIKRILLLASLVLFVCPASVFAQSYVEFLGPAYGDEIKHSPKYGIAYRDNGFDNPLNRAKKQAKKRGAPASVLDEIRTFPGTPDAIGKWIDDAFDQARASFTKCGGRLADFASKVRPESLAGGVSIEATIWYEPALKAILAGGYYPDTQSIRVVNIYYGTTGDYRHARPLLVWEMKNHFGTLAGIQSEPVTADWPCRAR